MGKRVGGTYFIKIGDDMTEKRFTHKEDDWEILDRNKHFAYAHSGCQAEKIIQELNELVETNRELYKENKQLKSENKRLIDKLNKTALELVDECISQGKATEISEMSYREFLDYRAENGKPMELHAYD